MIDFWQQQQSGLTFYDEFFRPWEPREEEFLAIPEEAPPASKTRLTCRHVFEISRDNCRACNGCRRDCPRYEEWPL